MSERKESNLHNESQILTHYRYATLRVKFPYSHERGNSNIFSKLFLKSLHLLMNFTFTSGCRSSLAKTNLII